MKVNFFPMTRRLAFLAMLLLQMQPALDGACLADSPGTGGSSEAQKLLLDREYYPALLSHIEGARQEIVLVAFLFKATDSRSNRPAAVIRKLIEARHRGVRVEVVLEKSGYDDELNEENRKVADHLQRNNIAVRFDSAKKTTHAKLVIIDQRFILLGSHNLTHSALAANHEVSMLIDNHRMATELLSYIKKL